MKRLLKILFSILFLVFFGSIVGLVGTTQGLDFIAKQAQYLMHGKLKIHHVQGRIIDGFTISGFSYHDQGTIVEVNSFVFSWNSKALLNGKFHIRQLQAEGIHLQRPPSQTQPQKPQESSPQFPNIQLPLSIIVDNLRLKTVSIQQSGAKPIVVHQLELKTVVNQQLTLEYLRFDSPQLRLKTAGKVALQFPYPLQLETDWQVNLPHYPQMVGQGQLHGNIQQLTIAQTLSKPNELKLQTTIDQPLKDLTWTAQLDWKNVQWPLVTQTPQVHSQQGSLRAYGTLKNYQLDLTATIAATPTLPPAKWSVKAQGDLQQMTIIELKNDVFGSQVNAHGQVQWRPTLKTQVNLTAKNLGLKSFWQGWPENLTLDTQLIAQLEGSQLTIEQWQVNIPKTSSRLTMQGTAILAGQDTSLKTVLNWQQLQWPLSSDTILVKSHQGQLQLEGALKNYQLQLMTEIAGKNIPNGHWQLKGQGNETALEFEQLQGHLLKGNVRSSGKVQWRPTVTWAVVLKGDKINPAVQWSEWPGSLFLDLESQGNLTTSGQLQTQVKINTIQGQLRQYPLKLRTEISIDNTHYQVKNLHFQSGDTLLTAQGSISDTLSVQWALESSNLTTILPQLRGSIKGKGQLTGPLTLPHIVATASAHTLAFKEHQLANLQAKIDVDLNNQNAMNVVDIDATDLRSGSQSVKQIRLQGRGKMTDHTLTTNLTIEKLHLSLQLTGNFDPKKQQWQGQLAQLKADSKDFGIWKELTSAPLILSKNHVELATFCLKQNPTQICTAVNWQKGNTDLQVKLEKLSSHLAKPFFPPNFNLEGIIEGQLTGTLHSDNTLQTEAIIHVLPGKIETKLVEETLYYQGGILQLQIDPRQGLRTQLELNLLKQGLVKGNFHLPNFTRIIPTAEQSLQGKIQLELDNLDLVPLFVPQIENPKGSVEALLQVEGTLTQPILNGKLQTRQVTFDLLEQGLTIKDLNATVEATRQGNLNVDASLRSGEGQLKLAGKVQLPSATHWNLQLQLTGDQLEVINTPVAWALASPKINIEADPIQINVTGSVFIPEAVITPLKAPSGSIAVSPDVTVVTSETPETKQKSGEKLAIYSQVRLTLGEKVTVKGAGFGGRLGGTLVASNKPHQVTIGNGELQIIEGFYKAYGQNLKIQHGKIIFAGTPIENPALEIRAFRQIKQALDDDIIAGVHIQGNAQTPQLSLYAQPMMDQSNILSYLLLGKPVAQIAGNEGQILLNALSSIPFGQGDDSTTEKIARQLGLDTIEVSSEGGVEAAALVVGKYLSPRLYISYGIGLFDNSNVVRLRYELTKRLTVETETGTQSGVDLRYSIER